MDAFDALMQPFWQRLGVALLHFLWQGSAVALLVAAVLWLGRVRRPQVRYAWLLGGLAVMAACPVVSFALIEMPVDVSGKGDRHPPPSDHTLSRPQHTGASPLFRTDSERDAAAVGHDFVPSSGGPTTVAVPARGWLPYVVLGWLAGVVLLCGRLLLGAAGARRLRRRCRPVPAEWSAVVERLSGRLGLRGRVAAGLSRDVADALAVGLWRPLVVLPCSWAAALPPDVLEAVLAHELAHIRRRDLWVNLLQRVVETLLFYHPAVWWLSHRLRVERELCCDGLAVAATGRRLAYAEALEFVARTSRAARRPAWALQMGGREMTLLNRVRHVLGREGDRRPGWWPAGLIALAVPALVWLASLPAVPVSADEDAPVEVKEERLQKERYSAELERARALEAERKALIALEAEKRALRQALRAEKQALEALRAAQRDKAAEAAERDALQKREAEKQVLIERLEQEKRKLREKEARGDKAVSEEERERTQREEKQRQQEPERRKILIRGEPDPRDRGRHEQTLRLRLRPDADQDGRERLEKEGLKLREQVGERELLLRLLAERGIVRKPPAVDELLPMFEQLRDEVQQLRREVRELRAERDRPIRPGLADPPGPLREVRPPGAPGGLRLERRIERDDHRELPPGLDLPDERTREDRALRELGLSREEYEHLLRLRRERQERREAEDRPSRRPQE